MARKEGALLRAAGALLLDSWQAREHGRSRLPPPWLRCSSSR